MKAIKLLIWILVVVVVAYFMTDIKIGDKTIKKHIDTMLSTKKGVRDFKNKIIGIFKGNRMTEALVDEEKAPEEKTKKNKYGEEITEEESEKLVNELKKNK